MRLCELLDSIEYESIIGDKRDFEINRLSYFSKEADSKTLFFAIIGFDEDGHDYIEEVVRRGVKAVVLSKIPKDVQGLKKLTTIIKVKDVRKALAQASCRFYNNPSEHMQVIGVTGTKGKTSVAFMIKHILESAGIKTGIIGTVFTGYGDKLKKSKATTPESLELQKILREMADNGCKTVVMEVSSQGLMLKRVHGIDFNIGVFTNISPDHIGKNEHRDYQHYIDCKGMLFDMCKRAVINGDDKNWHSIVRNKNLKQKIFFGSGENHSSQDFDFSYSNVKNKKLGGRLCAEFTLRALKPYGDGTKRTFRLGLPGIFNVENAAAASATARALGIPWENIKHGLETVYVPGRMETVDTGDDMTVIVDYAHNGISLRNTLEALRKYEPKRLMVVFGCGGDRDKNRRFEMGKAAFELADYIIITSDNPRSEEPKKIIEDITSVMEFCHKVILSIPDRREAIERAMTDGGKGDILVIAGKGHETYQIIGKNIIEFDDKQVALSCGKDLQ